MLRSVDQGGVWTEIESITPVGRELMFDITVDDEEHTYVAEDLHRPRLLVSRSS